MTAAAVKSPQPNGTSRRRARLSPVAGAVTARAIAGRGDVLAAGLCS